MPININICGPLDEAKSHTHATTLSASTKKAAMKSSSVKSKEPSRHAAVDRANANRPKASASITMSPRHRSHSPMRDSRSQSQAWSLSSRPLSPRQIRCPACMEMFHSQFTHDEHFCPRRSSASTASTVKFAPSQSQSSSGSRLSQSARSSTGGADDYDFDISISRVNDAANAAAAASADSEPSYSPSHNEQMYYRKLADLNAECQRLQSQRDHLLEAHSQHNEQQAQQWSQHLEQMKTRIAELERKLKHEKELGENETKKNYYKIEENNKTIKQQRDDILRLIEQHEQHRRLIDSWKHDRHQYEDEILTLRRLIRDHENTVMKKDDVINNVRSDSEKAISHWKLVAQRAEEAVVVLRQEGIDKESERKSRELSMKEELIRLINEMKVKETDWVTERNQLTEDAKTEKSKLLAKLDDASKTIAALKLSSENAKTEILNQHANIAKLTENQKSLVDDHHSEVTRLTEAHHSATKAQHRDYERLSQKLFDCETEKSRLESMVEQMIVKMESMIQEKSDNEGKELEARAALRSKFEFEVKELRIDLEDMARKSDSLERELKDEREKFYSRLNEDKGEKKSLLKQIETLKIRLAQEAKEKDLALKNLLDTEEIMRAWREEHAREEERRRRDKRDKRERKEREERHRLELESVRRQVRKQTVDRLVVDDSRYGGSEFNINGDNDRWNIEITPMERDGWDSRTHDHAATLTSDRPKSASARVTVTNNEEKVQSFEDLLNRSYRHSALFDVDVDIDDGVRGHDHRRLTLSPGQSVRVDANDVDHLNIRI